VAEFGVARNEGYRIAHETAGEGSGGVGDDQVGGSA
jgi:hypothetical protein